jgi:hypothetical protein
MGKSVFGWQLIIDCQDSVFWIKSNCAVLGEGFRIFRTREHFGTISCQGRPRAIQVLSFNFVHLGVEVALLLIEEFWASSLAIVAFS